MEGSALTQLCECLDSDTYIEELGIVHPSELPRLWQMQESCNESQMDRCSFWYGSHKLAISSSVLSSLYSAAVSAFRNEDGTCKDRLMSYSKALVVLNSDYASAWNARKRIILTETNEEVLMAELRLSTLVLSLYPKSEQAWCQRRWIIKRFEGHEKLASILDAESKHVGRVAERYPMNYRAWRQRSWLVPFMDILQVRRELHNTKEWVSHHVSDNSAFHYRRFLITRMLDFIGLSEDSLLILKDERDWTKDLLKIYIGREAVWIHRRFLASIQYRMVNTEWDLFKNEEIQFVEEYTSIHPDNHASSYKFWIYFLERNTPELKRSCEFKPPGYCF